MKLTEKNSKIGDILAQTKVHHNKPIISPPKIPIGQVSIKRKEIHRSILVWEHSLSRGVSTITSNDIDFEGISLVETHSCQDSD